MRLFPRQDYDRVVFVYDTNVLPISFDICWALAWADLQTSRLGRNRFDVVIIMPCLLFRHSKPEDDPDYVSRHELIWRVHQILVPLAAMYRATGALTTISSEDWPSARHKLTRCGHVLAPTNLTTIYRETLAGERPPSGFTAPPGTIDALQDLAGHSFNDRVISITIRESRGGAARNSDLVEWTRFGEVIAGEGFLPVFVPDTDRWYVPTSLPGLTLPMASLNMSARVALYESATLNMFVNSGPASICYLSPDFSYIMFKILAAGERLSSIEVLNELGFREGEGVPFASERQKWVWESDRFEVILREFRRMLAVGANIS